jgi:hypothetical protein
MIDTIYICDECNKQVIQYDLPYLWCSVSIEAFKKLRERREPRRIKLIFCSNQCLKDYSISNKIIDLFQRKEKS